ncbi:GGDEF domain-containing protein [Mycobacterium sp. CBMA293]|uniref:GGDEF domain-containing protein n=1 Tax=unclassified Mycolicibacterium TaxID=2636767 RepID=UPI0012DEE5C3|nr:MULTISPECIES: GGDEF domain-containing protein [unclassified Mycolicibacterium]MUL48728.1 GGDEF domain-containing protein [Mycolicibacterium sp. CBMA 360]MUL93598.1 GGDEF domain-containing protein [Mycolicibacterium sp. CBMA 230]MUM34758.1 GGDEF domain-containing protein [Mycolicibacterium sp. CBMA 361]MUL62182.1 GGDEF domain-containing protein [Mycolicibacterium sp. CBMA 335]MUL71643.1 GGDEF domain-containing protein [Mycolicibacterium sp. CBMA 311]
MNPDVRTLWMVVSMTCLLFGLLHAWVGAGKRRHPAVQLWGAGNFTGAVGAGLLSARGVLPDVLSVTLANVLLVACWSCIWGGLCAFNEQPIRGRVMAAGPLVVLAGFEVLPPFTTSIPARVSLTVLALVGYFTLSVVACVKAQRIERLATRRILIGLYVVVAAATVGRSVSIHLHAGAVQFVTATPIASVSMLLFAFAVMAINLGLSLMGWERLEDQLADAAMLDSLTSTLNRAGFMIQAQRLAEECVVRQLRCSVIVMDLDEFKAVNDVYGHEAGDCLLAEFASVARSNLRSGDLLARIGGEEFCAMLPGVDESQAAVIADRLRVAFAMASFTHNDVVLAGTVSIGVSQLGHKAGLRSAIRRADVAMYEAKNRGRDRVIRASVAKEPR